MSKAVMALAATSGFQALTAIRQGQAQAAQYRAEAQAAEIKRQFDQKQQEIQRQKDILDIKEEQNEILKDTSRSLAFNIASGAASGLMKDNVLNTVVLQQGLDEYLAGNRNLNLLQANYEIIGNMIDREARNEIASKEQAAVNVKNLSTLQAGGYLAQGYLNYQKYKPID
jgi:mannitol-specific phosphotransferase system IIBC component|tara:strand:+ start:207 stop:716 length:510 start_codon:yes stop_codon:yes gene_type:complete